MAGLIANLFSIRHNRLAALEQEYELAKEHQAEVLRNRILVNPSHQQRLVDANERLNAARNRFLAALDEQG